MFWKYSSIALILLVWPWFEPVQTHKRRRWMCMFPPCLSSRRRGPGRGRGLSRHGGAGHCVRGCHHAQGERCPAQRHNLTPYSPGASPQTRYSNVTLIWCGPPPRPRRRSPWSPSWSTWGWTRGWSRLTCWPFPLPRRFLPSAPTSSWQRWGTCWMLAEDRMNGEIELYYCQCLTCCNFMGSNSTRTGSVWVAMLAHAHAHAHAHRNL